MINTNDEFLKEESNESQCNRILTHLQEGKTITSLEALNLFRCMRLASRISDLRRRGHSIVSERIKTQSGKYVAQYRLEDKP